MDSVKYLLYKTLIKRYTLIGAKYEWEVRFLYNVFLLVLHAVYCALCSAREFDRNKQLRVGIHFRLKLGQLYRNFFFGNGGGHLSLVVIRRSEVYIALLLRQSHSSERQWNDEKVA